MNDTMSTRRRSLPAYLRDHWRLLVAAIPFTVSVAYIVFGGRRAGDLKYAAAQACVGVTVMIGLQAVAMRRQRPQPVVIGTTTQLRRMVPADLPAFRATLEPDVIAENRMSDSYIAEMEHVIRARTAQLFLAICPRGTRRIAGIISVGSAHEGAALQIGVWVRTAERGKGYTTDALRAITALLGKLDLGAVTATTGVYNAAMRAALLRAGFQEQEHFVHRFDNGDEVDAIRYACDLPTKSEQGEPEHDDQRPTAAP